MAAGTFPDTVAVAASFHGAALATERPDSPHRLAPAMRSRVYVGVAAMDHNFSSEEKQRLEDALEARGVQFTLEVYPDARHGFAVTGHPVYRPRGIGTALGDVDWSLERHVQARQHERRRRGDSGGSMKNKVIGWTLVALCVTAFAPPLVAQQARVSPHETHSSLVDGATITIT